MSIECIVICVIYESLNKIIKEITLYIVLKFINNSWAIQPMIITYLITRCHLDNPVKLDESH
jgi:hypothetical protein